MLFAVLGTGMFFSCSDYLESDQYFEDRMTLERVFKNKQYTEEWLAHVYADFSNENMDVSSKGNGVYHCFADDMYYGDRDGDYDAQKIGELSYNKFKTGDYDENTITAVWTRSYRGIRNATTFIHNIYMNEELNEDEIVDYRGQARFARAYFYWLLLRKYGPIPILPDEGIDYTESYDDIATPRSTYEECADYIAKEMLQAALELEKLDISRQGQDASARASYGAALATRAKALLYAASPIANGNNESWAQQLTDDAGRPLLSPDYQDEKWAKAAAAARDVIELGIYQLYWAYIRTTGDDSNPATVVPPADGNFSEKDWPNGWRNIDPAESYRQVFDGTLTASGNPELIFTRGTNQGGEGMKRMVEHQLPRNPSKGWNTHGLTQKQIDAYYMNDGSDAPGKDSEIGRGDGSRRLTGFVTQDDYNNGKYKPLREGVSLQYANREPRFYASVAYNGSFWNLLDAQLAENRNMQIFYYRGEENGYSAANAYWLRTGIGSKKFIHQRDAFENDQARIVAKPEPAIRYADILLMYAEALNELDGTYTIPSWKGENYTISRDIAQMKRGIQPVRIRGGIADYPESVYSNKTEMRKRLKRERQIELMAEGQRYYDLRRWLDADVEESLPIYGCNVLMSKNDRELFHQPVAEWSLRTSFSDKMWFWPISHSELKRNNRLTQNPGWTYND